jgi:hypothetical protein
MENWVNLVRSVSIPTKDNAGRSMIRPQQLSPHDFPRTNFIYGNTPLIYLGLVLKPEAFSFFSPDNFCILSLPVPFQTMFGFAIEYEPELL